MTPIALKTWRWWLIVALAGLWPAGPIVAQAPDGLSQFDLTRNKIVNAADAWSVIAAWQGVRRMGQCSAAAVRQQDVDGSGCVTVADVQAVLAHWGERAGEQVEIAGAPSATFVVNSSGDNLDANPGNGVCQTAGGQCTLRAALEEANVRPGPETINFNVRNTNGSCPNLVVLRPASPLTIDSASYEAITVDGYSQCGASVNTGAVTGNAVIKVEVQGNNLPLSRGLYILSPNVVLRGLAVYNWEIQLFLLGGAARNGLLTGNFIGTNAANTFRMTTEDAGWGVFAGDAPNNIFGGTTPALRNIFAGNGADGILFQSEGTTNNLVIGNYFGLKQDGRTLLPNLGDCVDLGLGANGNRVGGLNPGERNVLSGSQDGIEISHQATTSDNVIVGNYIGVNASGTGIVGNQRNGINVEDSVHHNSLYGNVIAGNGSNGIRLWSTHHNQVYDNLIGVLPDGTTAAGNGTGDVAQQGRFGMRVYENSQSNLIRNNLIANHPDHGISVNASNFNTLSQNSLYNNVGEGINLANGGNQNRQPPVIASAHPTQVRGQACPNCLIEVFIADKTQLPHPSGDNAGEGKTFIGQGVADGAGNFAVAVSGVALGQLVTATATDGLGNTSQFSGNVYVSGGPGPTPTRTPTATATPTATRTPAPGLTGRVWLPVIVKMP